MLTAARILAKLLIGFVGLTVILVVIFRFVPVPVTATMLMDENGITKDWRSLSAIDRNLVAAVIAAEDSRFCEHSGFDAEAIEQAMRENLEGGRIRGGSTISQQTAKNVFLWQGGGYFRKGLEAWFTFWIELVWGKRRIMEVYRHLWRRGRSPALFRQVRRAAFARRGEPDGGRPAQPEETLGEEPRRLARPPRQPHRAAHRDRQARWPRCLRLPIKPETAEVPMRLLQ